MPFIDGDREVLRRIELAQVPIMAPTFQLKRRIGYFEGENENVPVPADSEISWAEANTESSNPTAGNRTDLASVPSIFWSLIASYGRQTAPAIVHDAECWRVKLRARSGVSASDALADRERVDRRFRLGLRELDVPPFRAWIMWTFVSFERYAKHSIARLIGLILIAAVGLALVVFSPIALIALHQPVIAAISLVLPLATSAVTGRHWRLMVWASYAGALLLPVAVLQVGAYVPYSVLETIVWFLADGRKGRGSPSLGPVDLKNLRREAGEVVPVASPATDK
jgi:hypothetical protein